MSQAFPMPVPFCRFSPLLRVPPPYRTAQRSPCRTHWYNLWVGQSWALRHAQDLVLSELEELDVLFFFRDLGCWDTKPHPGRWSDQRFIATSRWSRRLSECFFSSDAHTRSLGAKSSSRGPAMSPFKNSFKKKQTNKQTNKQQSPQCVIFIPFLHLQAWGVIDQQ